LIKGCFRQSPALRKQAETYAGPREGGHRLAPQKGKRRFAAISDAAVRAQKDMRRGLE